MISIPSRAVLKLMVLTVSALWSDPLWSAETRRAVTSFVIPTHSLMTTIPKIKNLSKRHHNNFQKFQWKTFMMTNPDDDGGTGTTYDLSKPIYDLYALRMVRGDAIIQYNLRNQSEPLRINLALIGTLFLICLPSLITEFSGGTNSAIAIPTTMPLVTPDLSVTIPQTIASWFGAIGCFVFGIQQAGKRNKQLLRIEKECSAGDLSIQLPMTWIAADRPYQKQQQSIRSVIKGKSCRILAMSGPASMLQHILQNELIIYNRRWKQSNTYWVLVPSDLPTSEQRSTFISQARYPWLAQAYDYDSWNRYFQSLQTAGSTTGTNNAVSWFGLSATGRSFGSGATKPTSYLQILGNSLSPVDILYNEEETLPKKKDVASQSASETMLLSCQQRFYDALTSGNLPMMKNDVFAAEIDCEVSDIIQQGGRLDPWDVCLLADAKPTGMTISDREVILLSGDNEATAYTTCIEFPVDTYMGGVIPTLLAVQKWKQTTTTTESDTEEWKLVQHQTIPWTSERAAGGTLMCDCRGVCGIGAIHQHHLNHDDEDDIHSKVKHNIGPQLR